MYALRIMPLSRLKLMRAVGDLACGFRLWPTDINRVKIMKNIADAFPEWAGVDDQDVRDKFLPEYTKVDINGLVKAQSQLDLINEDPSSYCIPKTILLDIPASVEGSFHSRPTHVLALCREGECEVIKYCPAHRLVLAAHCANLTQFAPSSVTTTSSKYTVPVQGMCIPAGSSPEAFEYLQLYLYTKDTGAFGPDFHCSRDYIWDIYRIAFYIGVVDDKLYNHLYDALQVCSSYE